ncbi:MAG TPA: tripartite tricarboxylate transporter TctB family protein [Candidatus Lambdaproteobacteria bacterium]|nr:tripartite tricarboxylate transporter TctB family protein [Candidatus Lambdaproteobacteria bacterium]
MSKLKTSHKVETLIWLTIVVVFFGYSFEFSQEIEIYKFGATGWPRVVLGLLLLVTLGNFLHLYKKGSEAQQGRVGITDQEEDISYDGIGSIKKLIAILAMPLIFAWSLKPVGFYSATPVFIVLIIVLLGEKRIKWVIGITLFIYFLLIFLFMVILNAPLPQGNISPFYDFSAFMLTLNTKLHQSLNF